MEEGVPALLGLFEQYKIQATFLFALGPQRPLQAILDGLRPVGGATLSGRAQRLWAWRVPLGRRGRSLMRRVADAGHEVGILGWDVGVWAARAPHADRRWTRLQLEAAQEEFQRVFGHRSEVHGAADWQVNPHLLNLEDELGFRYGLDTRGLSPYYPELLGAAPRCPQFPTTLPTSSELVGRGEVAEDNVHEHLFFASQKNLVAGHLFTAQAEVEGRWRLPLMEKLIVMWRDCQRAPVPARELVGRLDLGRLPRHRVGWGQVDGRAGYVAMQGQRLAEPARGTGRPGGGAAG